MVGPLGYIKPQHLAIGETRYFVQEIFLNWDSRIKAIPGGKIMKFP